jgi:hypothetical protein
MRNPWPLVCIEIKGSAHATVTERGKNVEESLKSLMQDLGNAINESLSDSERIAEAIGEIKSAGYDVFLVLEATIGFNKRESVDEADDDHTLPIEAREVAATGKVRFTTQDQRFLKALRISSDSDSDADSDEEN